MDGVGIYQFWGDRISRGPARAWRCLWMAVFGMGVDAEERQKATPRFGALKSPETGREMEEFPRR